MCAFDLLIGGANGTGRMHFIIIPQQGALLGCVRDASLIHGPSASNSLARLVALDRHTLSVSIRTSFRPARQRNAGAVVAATNHTVIAVDAYRSA
ncbi:MAG: hypothetical protein QFF03_16540 [Pseudomonadota bacterium]|nr:hypothetical protein [Pseudomonadota bacterium]